jgi:hypothetical protein
MDTEDINKRRVETDRNTAEDLKSEAAHWVTIRVHLCPSVSRVFAVALTANQVAIVWG